MIVNLCIVKHGGSAPVIEDEAGATVSADILVVAELHGLPHLRAEEDGRDLYVWYGVDVHVSGNRTRGCPPAPRSSEQGGDPGEPPTIEDLKADVDGCPTLSKVLGAHFHDLFLRALLEHRCTS